MKQRNDVKWHNRYGHLNYKILCQLQQKKIVRDLNQVCFRNDPNCVTCIR